MAQRPGDNVRRLSDRQPIGLVPGDLEPEAEPLPEHAGGPPEPPDYPAILHGLADSLAADLATQQALADGIIEVLKRRIAELAEQRDWAFVNRDTHYQRVLQLEAENAELRRELGR